METSPGRAAIPIKLAFSLSQRGVLILLTVALALQFINSFQELPIYNATHWVWDYSTGFIKRGLPGNIMERLFGSAANHFDVISSIAIGILVVAALLYLVLCHVVMRASNRPVVVFVAFAGAILAPALPQFAYDIGRFDQINFILLMLGCFAILRGSVWVAALSVTLLSTLAMFVHEGFLLTFQPLLLTLFGARLRVREAHSYLGIVMRLMLVALVPFSAFLFIWQFGGAEISQVQWVEYWRAQAAFLRPIEELPALSIHYDALHQHMSDTMGGVRLVNLFFSAATIVSSLWLAWVAWRLYDARCEPAIPLLTAAAAGTPMLMHFLGIDYLRWATLTCINLVIALLCLFYLLKDTGTHNVRTVQPARCRIHKRGVMLVLVCLYLFMPQSAGVVEPRYLPNSFLCAFGVKGVYLLEPVNPDRCVNPKWSARHAPQ